MHRAQQSRLPAREAGEAYYNNSTVLSISSGTDTCWLHNASLSWTCDAKPLLMAYNHTVHGGTRTSVQGEGEQKSTFGGTMYLHGDFSQSMYMCFIAHNRRDFFHSIFVGTTTNRRMFAYSDVTFYYGPIRATSGLWSMSHPRAEAEKPRISNIVIQYCTSSS